MSLISRTHNFVVSCESVIWHFPLGACEVITHFDIREKSRDYAENITTAQNLVSWVCAPLVLYFHKFHIVPHQDIQFRFFLDLPKWQSLKYGGTEALQPVPFPEAFVIPFPVSLRWLYYPILGPLWSVVMPCSLIPWRHTQQVPLKCTCVSNYVALQMWPQSSLFNLLLCLLCYSYMELFGQIGYNMADQRIGVSSLQGKDTFYFLYKFQILQGWYPAGQRFLSWGSKAATARSSPCSCAFLTYFAADFHCGDMFCIWIFTGHGNVA